MFVILGTAVFFALTGGQIAVMITDFLQGQFMNIVVLIILAFLFVRFQWADIVDTLQKAPAGKSMLNPFDQGELRDFNVGFYVMLAFLAIYTYMAHPTAQGYNSSAKSPHEAKMARMLASWRYAVFYLLLMMMPICAYVIMNSDLFPLERGTAQAMLNSVENSTVRQQLTVSVAMTSILPVGFVGLFAAVMFAAGVSSDDTQLHTFGSIFIQDVLIPLGKKPKTPQQHLKWLRRAILGVAVFLWLFGMIFPLHEYIFMFSAIAGAIFVGGAGAVLIGGLYWKRGTTAGAWAAMIVGSSLAFLSVFILNVFWPHILPGLKNNYSDVVWLQNLPEKLPINGMHMAVVTAICALIAYITVSLLTKVDFDFSMDKMLHRGKYASGDKKTSLPLRGWKTLGWGPEFSRSDKFIYILYFGWTAITLGWFIVFTVINLLTDVSDDAWATWWLIYLIVGTAMAVFTTIWFLFGGFRDLFSLFKTLKTAKRNILDNGTVKGHQNISDEDL